MTILTELGLPILAESGLPLLDEYGNDSAVYHAMRVMARLQISGRRPVLRTPSSGIVFMRGRAKMHSSIRSATLSTMRKISGKRITLGANLRHGSGFAPRIRAQLNDDALLIISETDVQNLHVTISNDVDSDVITPTLTLISKQGELPAILRTDAQGLSAGSISKLLTVNACYMLGSAVSSASSINILVPALIPQTDPPQSVTATLVRDKSATISDLIRVEWDWGDLPPQTVSIEASVYVTGEKVRRLPIGICTHAESSTLIESLSKRITKSLARFADVYFCVYCYRNGATGKFTTSNGSVLISIATDDAAIPLHCSYLELVRDVKQQVTATVANPDAQTPQIIEQALNQALIRTKAIVALGGSVSLDSFGTFKAAWNADNTERRPTFTPSRAFKDGTAQGIILVDD